MYYKITRSRKGNVCFDNKLGLKESNYVMF